MCLQLFSRKEILAWAFPWFEEYHRNKQASLTTWSSCRLPFLPECFSDMTSRSVSWGWLQFFAWEEIGGRGLMPSTVLITKFTALKGGGLHCSCSQGTLINAPLWIDNTTYPLIDCLIRWVFICLTFWGMLTRCYDEFVFIEKFTEHFPFELLLVQTCHKSHLHNEKLVLSLIPCNKKCHTKKPSNRFHIHRLEGMQRN